MILSFIVSFIGFVIVLTLVEMALEALFPKIEKKSCDCNPKEGDNSDCNPK